MSQDSNKVSPSKLELGYDSDEDRSQIDPYGPLRLTVGRSREEVLP